MIQGFAVQGDLDNLEVRLDVKEEGKEVQYTFDLEADRSTCLIVREVFELDGGGEAISHQSWIRTLGEAKDDNATFAPVVIWILRGLWGIPMEFGASKERAESDVVVAGVKAGLPQV